MRDLTNKEINKLGEKHFEYLWGSGCTMAEAIRGKKSYKAGLRKAKLILKKQPKWI